MRSDINSTARPQLSALLRRTPAYFGLLLIVTGILLLWQHYGMHRVVELSARSGHRFTASSDSTDKGGTSTVKVTRVGDALQLDCQLARVKWPYCKIRFELSAVAQGLDLSTFDSVTIDADYTKSGPGQIKLYLVNFDRDWSRLDNWMTQKVNEADPFDLPVGRSADVPLDVFYTATWWKEQTRPPLRRSGMRMDNVIGVELSTHAEDAGGHHVLTLRSIRFHGKFITKNTLLTALISVWIASAMGWAGILSYTLRRELATSKAQLKLLGEINRALKLETEQLAGQAHHDPLTGALNREGLRAELMSTSTLMTDPVSVVFLDIDHFKRINDQHGHQTGDLVLRQFVAVVGANIRTSDRLVRWGGEEFLLVCPASDVDQAAALAEKLRLCLVTASWPNAIGVTSSFGVAQHHLNESITDVIKRADEQLYAAKRAGRNRVHADGGRPGVFNAGMTAPPASLA